MSDTSKPFKIEKTFHLEEGEYSATYLLAIMMGLVEQKTQASDKDADQPKADGEKKRGRPPASIIKMREMIGQEETNDIISCCIQASRTPLGECPDGPPSIKLVMQTLAWISSGGNRVTDFNKCLVHLSDTGRTKTRSMMYDVFSFMNRYGASHTVQWLFVTLESGGFPPAAMHSALVGSTYADFAYELVMMGLRWEGVAPDSDIHRRMQILPYPKADEHLAALGLPQKGAEAKPAAKVKEPAPAAPERKPHAVKSSSDFDPNDFGDEDLFGSLDVGATTLASVDARPTVSCADIVEDLSRLRSLLAEKGKDTAMAKAISGSIADRPGLAGKFSTLMDKLAVERAIIEAFAEIIMLSDEKSLLEVSAFFAGNPNADLAAIAKRIGNVSKYRYVD